MSYWKTFGLEEIGRNRPVPTGKQQPDFAPEILTFLSPIRESPTRRKHLFYWLKRAITSMIRVLASASSVAVEKWLKLNRIAP